MQSFKTFQECQHYKDTIFKFAFLMQISTIDNFLRSHFFVALLPNIFINESILIKNYMNANGSYPQIFLFK